MTEMHSAAEPRAKVGRGQAPGKEAVDRALGALLRAARIRRGSSLNELAGLIGLTYQQVQKYETGVNSLTIARYLQIAPLLGLSLADVPETKVKQAKLRNDEPADVQRLRTDCRLALDALPRRLLPAVKRLLDAMVAANAPEEE
jgi:transcriptional regulator with XRE-family HTH domain